MTRIFARLGPALALALALAAPAQAPAQQEGARAPAPVVVELFTSQGCSSCPPADALLGELAARPEVLALALHVDYWDYIGWTDTFADPAFTARQHAYGRAAGSRVVYTPQMVVGGIDHVVGVRAMTVADLIAAHRALPAEVALRVQPGGGETAVTADWVGGGTPPRMVVQLVTYLPEARVEIARGENAGRVADYHNIVRDWRVLAEWDGRAPFAARVVPQEGLRMAVIVQRAEHGAILGAARLD